MQERDAYLSASNAQIGEVLGSIRGLIAAIEARNEQSLRMHALLREDLSTLRTDQRDLEEKLDCVVCVVQHELERLQSGAAIQARSMEGVIAALDELRQPVAEIAALRSRVAGAIVCLGIVGSTVLWLAEPVYRWVVESYLKH